jgi:NADH-quinone oxidoreductase subunit A
MSEQSISSWGQVLLFIIGGLLFVSGALLVSRIIRPSRPNPEKLTSYESGEDPVGSPWIQFNVRFYVIALIFLLFEVEIVFLFPWATIFSDKKLISETGGTWGWIAMSEMIIFIGLLAVGLVYAWTNGHLDWIKPKPQVSNFKSPVPQDLYKKINEQYAGK